MTEAALTALHQSGVPTFIADLDGQDTSYRIVVIKHED